MVSIFHLTHYKKKSLIKTIDSITANQLSSFYTIYTIYTTLEYNKSKHFNKPAK